MVRRRQALLAPITFVLLNRRDLLTSPLSSTQRQPMPKWPSRIVIFLHTMVSRLRTWPAHITFVLHIMVSRRRMWVAPIVSDLYTSLSRCHKWLPASPVAYSHQFADIRCCPCVSSVAFKYRSANVSRRLGVSPMSCTPWSANVGHACRHCMWLALVRRVMLHATTMIELELTTC